jgi:hypothetical protein
MFQSFAFRRGLPLDADFVFDARCLPNPHWHPHLRPLSGKDAPVRDFLDIEPLVGEYFTDTARWLDAWLPRFEARRPQLHDHRHRLHRRPASLGLSGRETCRPLPRTTRKRTHLPSRTRVTTMPRHTTIESRA